MAKTIYTTHRHSVIANINGVRVPIVSTPDDAVAEGVAASLNATPLSSTTEEQVLSEFRVAQLMGLTGDSE